MSRDKEDSKVVSTTISWVYNQYNCLVELVDVLTGMLARKDASATSTFIVITYSFFELWCPLFCYDCFKNIIIRILFSIIIFRIILSGKFSYSIIFISFGFSVKPLEIFFKLCMASNRSWISSSIHRNSGELFPDILFFVSQHAYFLF